MSCWWASSNRYQTNRRGVVFLHQIKLNISALPLSLPVTDTPEGAAGKACQRNESAQLADPDVAAHCEGNFAQNLSHRHYQIEKLRKSARALKARWRKHLRLGFVAECLQSMKP